MAQRPWRTSAGLVAVLVWSAVIGLPVLLFHLNGQGLDLGQHVHAAFLFVASQILVFWLAARSSTAIPTRLPKAFQHRPPALAIPSEHQIWQAELVPSSEDKAVPDVPAANHGNPFQPCSDWITARVTVSNYLGSSRIRIVTIEPGSLQRKLLPGQELEITATARVSTPRFRFVESDLATQIYVEGVGVEVSLSVEEKVDSHLRPDLNVDPSKSLSHR